MTSAMAGSPWRWRSAASPTALEQRLSCDSDLRPEFLMFGEAPSRILVSSADT